MNTCKIYESFTYYMTRNYILTNFGLDKKRLYNVNTKKYTDLKGDIDEIILILDIDGETFNTNFNKWLDSEATKINNYLADIQFECYNIISVNGVSIEQIISLIDHFLLVGHKNIVKDVSDLIKRNSN
jgi:hypothetical protein